MDESPPTTKKNFLSTSMSSISRSAYKRKRESTTPTTQEPTPESRDWTPLCLESIVPSPTPCQGEGDQTPDGYFVLDDGSLLHEKYHDIYAFLTTKKLHLIV